MIKLDSAGPVIYKSMHIGEDGNPFTMFKVRSM
jgi:lipopolysaccharide/colanic/teichoic acid biosynthesis glycosyltransferase